MNCVEFRRQLGVDPHSSGAEFVRHRADCVRCADAAARAMDFDRDLQHALQIEPPAQLIESVLFAQATAERRRRTALRRGVFLALAASLALAVGVIGTRVEAKPLSGEAVEHLEGEAEVLAMTTELPAAKITEAFAKRGLSLRQVPTGISFVGCCPMGKHQTVHMLMPNGDDPISVIYVVDVHAAQRENFSRRGWTGRIVPMGKGTLVLLAKHATAFDRIETVWSDALVGGPQS